MHKKSMLTWLASLALFASATVHGQATPKVDAVQASDSFSQISYTPADSQGRYVYMIEFQEPELFDHPSRSAGEPFDLDTPTIQAARDELIAAQAQHVEAIGGTLGRSVDPSHHYLISENGVAARLTPAEAERVAGLDSVKTIERERQYELATYRGPEFIGADSIWNGSAVPGGTPLLGEEMIAAVLDTGIPAPGAHDSFANDPACGHGTGGIPDKVLSSLDCSSTDGAGLCNGASPNDTNGHGSHTASTVAGNVVDSSSTPAPDLPDGFAEMSGVAPCAHVRSYKVCPGQSCPGADIAAGLESVLIHGDADVLNYSISGGASPWTDNDRTKLDLVDQGVFVAASAGNTSTAVPDPVGQVNHRGPWVMSVAASTHDTVDGLPVSLVGGPTDVAGVEGTGPALASTFTGQLRFAGDVDGTNPEGCSAFPANAFDGEAALISRGSCAFTDKVNNAVDAGASFVVVFNNVGGPPIVMGGLEATTVSSVMVDNAAGTAMVSALAGGTAEVTVNATAEAFTDPAYGDVLANFSFRGPTPSPLQDLQKPDITAPGVSIYAAVPGGYDFIGGTSMSSPHIAGAGALVRQANPGWTVSEVKSALQMTAAKDGLDDDGAAPWDWDDVGSGRADLTAAALAGVVMDETVANYLAADPSTGGDVKTLNTPSVRNLSCTPDCTWERTLRNTLETASDWTVSTSSLNPDLDIQVTPSTFSFTGDTSETVTLTITAAPQADLTSEIVFGEVVLTEDAAQAPEAHLTVAASGAPGTPPEIAVDPENFPVLLAENSTTSADLEISNSGETPLNWDIQFDTSSAGGSIQGTTPHVIWEQQADGTGGIVSDFFTGHPSGDTGVYSANDFTAIPQQLIENIYTPGFWLSGDVSNANSISWYIYADDKGVPAGHPEDGQDAHVWSHTAAPGSAGIDITDNNITLDVVAATGSGVSLPSAGRYWLAIVPDINFGADLNDRWNWSQAVPAENTNHLVDPSDLFGAGATDWTPQTALGIAWTDSAFTLTGSVDCSATPPTWLSLGSTSGTAPGEGSSIVTLDFDSTGLSTGTYETSLCITSNDADEGLLIVPVEMDVVTEVQLPQADITPVSFDFTLDFDASGSDTLTIGNTGEGELIWDVLDEVQVPITGTGGDELLSQDFSGSFPPSGWSVVDDGSGCPWQTTDDYPMAAGAFGGNEWAGIGMGLRGAAVDSDDCGSGTAADTSLISPSVDMSNVTNAELGFDFALNAISGTTVTLDASTDGGGSWANLETWTSTFAHPDVSLPVTVDLSSLEGEGDVQFRWRYQAGWEWWVYVDNISLTGEVTAPCYTPAEIPWLTLGSTNGAVPGMDSQDVSVDIDTTGLEPGTLETRLCVYTNDGDNPQVDVPVSLEVTVPDHLATVEGTVQSLGYCSDNPAPAAGAEITIEGGGNVVTTTADGSGFYSAFVDEANSPVDITANAPDHLSQTATEVTIVGQQTTTTDFDLLLDAGCATVNPASFSDTLDAGVTQGYTLDIGNAEGGGDLSWSIDESEPAGAEYRYDLPGAGQLVSVPMGDRASGPVTGERHEGQQPNVVAAAQGGGAIAEFNEGFEDVTLLPGAGWAIQNLSEPLGATDWSQGSTATFESHAGPDDSYISANFNNTTGTGTISDWLLTPELLLINGTELTFWTRTTTGSSFPDRMEVRLSTSGSSTNVGASATDVGDFDVVLEEINPDLEVGGYPETWTQFTIEVSGLSAPTSGRFAFRYFVTSGGPSGTNSNFIGVDTVSVTQPLCQDPADVPWLSMGQYFGSTAAGASSQIDVNVDTTGLSTGEYLAAICVDTNDPEADVFKVPFSLSVIEDQIFQDRFEQ